MSSKAVDSFAAVEAAVDNSAVVQAIAQKEVEPEALPGVKTDRNKGFSHTMLPL